MNLKNKYPKLDLDNFNPKFISDYDQYRLLHGNIAKDDIINIFVEMIINNRDSFQINNFLTEEDDD